MPGTLSSSGTWTALLTDLTPHLMNGATPTNANATLNVPTVISMNPTDIRTVPEEVFRMIELIQEGYQTGSAPNLRRISFWTAASMLRTWVNSLYDSQTATNPASLNPQFR